MTHQKLRVFGSVLLAAGVLIGGAGARTAAAAPPSQAAAQNWNATVGHQIFTEQGDKASWQALRFYPETITINAGDSITWKFDAGAEPHTVTFLGKSEFPELIGAPPPGAQPGGGPPGGPGGALPPKVEANPLVFFKQGGNTYDGSAYTSSGIIAADIPGPKDFKLSFPTAGTYKYYCALHAGKDPASGQIMGMQGTVVVQAAGSALPKTAAQVNADAAALMKADEAKAMSLMPEVMKNAGTSRQNANGTTTYHVNVGYEYFDPSGTYALDYQRFAPKQMTINQGDTIEWSMPNEGFHTVTFGEEPEVFLVEPQASGPPKAYLNVMSIAPAGGQTYSGTGFYSSGVLSAPDAPEGASAPLPTIKSYSLTFEQAGRFEYICTVHYHNGMDGTVTVRARTGGAVPAGMPRTGNGYDWAVPGAVTGLLLALAGILLRRRKAHSTV